jgi:hypothetical protein
LVGSSKASLKFFYFDLEFSAAFIQNSSNSQILGRMASSWASIFGTKKYGNYKKFCRDNGLGSLKRFGVLLHDPFGDFLSNKREPANRKK